MVSSSLERPQVRRRAVLRLGMLALQCPPTHLILPALCATSKGHGVVAGIHGAITFLHIQHLQISTFIGHSGCRSWEPTLASLWFPRLARTPLAHPGWLTASCLLCCCFGIDLAAASTQMLNPRPGVLMVRLPSSSS